MSSENRAVRTLSMLPAPLPLDFGLHAVLRIPSARGWVGEAGRRPLNCREEVSPFHPRLRGEGSPHDPATGRGLRRVSLESSRARGLPFMVPCAGAREAPAAGVQDAGSPGRSRRLLAGHPIAAHAPPAGAGLGAGVLLQRRAAEAARRGEGLRGRSLGAPRPPPIPPPARSPLQAGELCRRPSPALPPSLPPSSSLLGPRPRSTSLVFSKLPRPGLFVPPRVPTPASPSPRPGAGP